MVKLKSKLIISTIVFILALITMQLSIYAANENIEIVQKSNSDYLIYIKDNLNTDFKFAFSNNKNEDKDILTFKKAETDSIEQNANKIAFVNSTTISLFTNPTYMWVKDETDNYIVEGIEIDLNQAISENELKSIESVTKIIPADTKQTTTTETEEDGKKVTTTVGKVVLPETQVDYEYILVELPNSIEYNNLMKLATRISKFNSETDMYTKINVYKEFNRLVTELRPDSNTSKWIEADGNEIEQPADAENGTQYVLWINENNGESSKQDVHFLTSYKEVSEERIIEKITTKLPVTYDNNMLLVVLAILIIATIVVCIRIKTLSKKEKQG